MHTGTGAYFGSASRIIQGAGGLRGLGQTDGPLMAYADGVVGGHAESAEMPGPLQAYRDGSLGRGLGQDGPLMAYADGVVGGHAESAEMPGPLQAYRDGSLGQDDGGGTDENGTLSAYGDGIFGTSNRDPAPGPLQAYRDGSLGRTRHFVGGMGEVATGAVLPVPPLDLGSEMVITEVKTLVGLLSPGSTMPTEFYTSGVWEPEASALWQTLVSQTPGFVGMNVSSTGGGQVWPAAVGIVYMLMTFSMNEQFSEKWVSEYMPSLYGWLVGIIEIGKTLPEGGPEPADPVVLAPYLSLADRAKGVRADGGGGKMKMSTMAMYGAGAVALLGVGLVLLRKKR
jgi:hypothetical protein